VSAAAGAGVYFEERRGLLSSLWLLLQAQVGTFHCSQFLVLFAVECSAHLYHPFRVR
jgi:hypothetical protein